jgi:hypothetical protein
MGILYADRGRIYVNGVEVIDIQSITVNVDDRTKVVETMTSDRRNKGWTRGNRGITFTAETAVQDKLASTKLEAIDYDSQDVSVQFQQGADKYLLKGVCLNTMSQSSSGVGSEGKKSFNFVALDLVDMVGNSALFPTALANLV